MNFASLVLLTSYGQKYYCIETQITSASGTSTHTWTSKRAQNNGPISQKREYRQYRVHYFGNFGGPGTALRDGFLSFGQQVPGHQPSGALAWSSPKDSHDYRRCRSCHGCCCHCYSLGEYGSSYSRGYTASVYIYTRIYVFIYVYKHMHIVRPSFCSG